eukprot:1659819-Amphidinium_carterae.1
MCESQARLCSARSSRCTLRRCAHDVRGQAMSVEVPHASQRRARPAHRHHTLTKAQTAEWDQVGDFAMMPNICIPLLSSSVGGGGVLETLLALCLCVRGLSVLLCLPPAGTTNQMKG